jgi:ribonuclease J
MSLGDHKYIKLHSGDTVVVSSSPIPGNEVSYDQISNRLSMAGVHLFRHPTHEVDGCGPPNVSGHARRDELREMIHFTKPTFFIPVHGGKLRRTYHAELGVQEGLPRKHCLTPDNGDSFYLTASNIEYGDKVPFGSVLIDQNGSVINGLVIKDRLMLAGDGIVTVVLTIDKKSGQALTSPDVISRGFITVRDNEELVNELRKELRRACQQRFKRVDLDRFKTEIRDYVTQFLYKHTGHCPIVIPVINVVGSSTSGNKLPDQPADTLPAKPTVDQEHQRFQEMRKRLLQH